MRRADIHQDGLRSQLRRVGDQPAHHVIPGVVIDLQGDRVSHCFSQTARYPYGIGIVDVLHALVCGCVADDGGSIVCLGNHIDSNERHGLAGGDNHCVVFDTGAHAQCIRQPG